MPWTYVISNFDGEELIGRLYEKELKKKNEKEVRIEKVIKKKGDKLPYYTKITSKEINTNSKN